MYSNDLLAAWFKRCWQRANPKTNSVKLPKVRVYDLRHRFASAILNRWIDAGCDLYAKLPYLRAYMGHEEMSATAYYIHLLPENLSKSPGINWDALNQIIPGV
jgi:integrase